MKWEKMGMEGWAAKCADKGEKRKEKKNQRKEIGR